MTTKTRFLRARGRRLSVGIALTTALTLALTACGSGNTTPGETPGGGSTTGETGNGGSGPEDITLNFAWWGDVSRADRYEAAIDIYEDQNPHVTIRTGYSGFSDYWTARNTEAASRSLPDIFQMDLAFLHEYAGFGHVLALDDYFGDVIDVDTVENSLVEVGQLDGQTYGLASSSNSFAMFVNAPLIEELGLEVPTEALSWDEFEALAVAISQAGADRTPKVYGALDYTQYFWLFPIWLNQQGKTFVADDGGLGFDESDLAEWWGKSAELQGSGAVMPPERQTQLDADALGLAEVAMDLSWDNFLVRFSEGAAAPQLTLLPPPFDAANNTGLFPKAGLMMSIGANSEHPEEAAKFIDFIVNDPAVGELFGMSRGVPASSSAREGLESNEHDDAILAYEESIAPTLDGTPIAPIPGLGSLEQNFVSMSQDVAYGTVTAEEAAANWFAEASLALG